MELKPKEFKYENTVEWIEGHIGELESVNKPILSFACPPEFGGEEGFWTPEDFFTGAVNTCFMTTFLSLLERKKLKIKSYSSKAEGIAKTLKGKLIFVEVYLTPFIFIPGETKKEDITYTLEEARKLCPVSSSIKCKVIIQPEIVVSD